jgi:predicted ribonuclease YlaK
MQDTKPYTGIKEIILSDQELADFYVKHEINNMHINEYLIIKNSQNEVIDKYRFDDNKFVKLKHDTLKGFKPKTYKQECCFDLMLNRNIPVKIIAGVAGSGKTKIVLNYGFYYLDKGWVNKIFIIRHNVSVGEKNGYFRGTKIDKALEWMGCIKDNIDDHQETLEEFITKGIVEVDVVESIKGRDIKNAWIIIDECEDLTEEQFKLIGERVSQGSYICFVGDYNQTSQDKYKKNNGLLRAFNSLINIEDVGFIVFDNPETDDVRSKVSKIFASKY